MCHKFFSFFGQLERLWCNLQLCRTNIHTCSLDFNEIPPFEITIVYLNLQKVVTHKLKNVEFTNDGVETSQGDTDIRRTFDIVMSDVKYR